METLVIWDATTPIMARCNDDGGTGVDSPPSYKEPIRYMPHTLQTYTDVKNVLIVVIDRNNRNIYN